MEALLSLAAAFVVMTSLAIYEAVQIGKMRKQIAERDELIEDLRDTVAGTTPSEDWRNHTL